MIIYKRAYLTDNHNKDAIIIPVPTNTASVRNNLGRIMLMYPYSYLDYKLPNTFDIDELYESIKNCGFNDGLNTRRYLGASRRSTGWLKYVLFIQCLEYDSTNNSLHFIPRKFNNILRTAMPSLCAVTTLLSYGIEGYCSTEDWSNYVFPFLIHNFSKKDAPNIIIGNNYIPT